MFIQYTAPGFEPTTFGREPPPITTRPGLPSLLTLEVNFNGLYLLITRNSYTWEKRLLNINDTINYKS